MTQGSMRFLLPHERWIGGWMLAKQRTHKSAAVVDLEAKYGPQGMVWFDAYFANLLFMLIPSAACFISIFATPTRTSRITLYLYAAVLLFLVLAAIRLVQAVRTARKLRRDRRT